MQLNSFQGRKERALLLFFPSLFFSRDQPGEGDGKKHLFVLFRGCEVYSTNNEIQEVHFNSGGAAFSHFAPALKRVGDGGGGGLRRRPK